MTSRLFLKPVITSLPEDIFTLQSDAAKEGFHFIERLVNEWEAGTILFNKIGETLLIARHDEAIAGIGGVTIDPVDHSALRMRRFYLRPSFRRQGIAKELAAALITDALKTDRPLNVNAGTEAAPPFWESMGFKPTTAQHHTHVWPRADKIHTMGISS